MSADVRVCPPERFAELLKAAEVAFGEDIEDDLIARLGETVDKERFVGAFDGERIVGTAGVFGFTLTVPGGEVRAGGVTWVTVMPSHRRQGLMSAMMRLMLDDCLRRGEPVAILWAAEAAIYQRFGYGMATIAMDAEAATQAVGFALGTPREGTFRILPAGEGRELVAPVYEAVRPRTPGFLARRDSTWVARLPLAEKDAKGGEARRLVVYETDAGPEAYAVYKTKSKWDSAGPAGIAIVEEAIGSTPRGTREIWRYLLDLDLVRTLKTGHLPPDHPLFTLSAEPRRLGLKYGDGIWLRILDVAAALEARSWGAAGNADGSLVIELADEWCPGNSGRWRIDAAGGRARVCRTNDPADIAMTVNELGAMYLGEFGATSLAVAGLVTELLPGGLATADTLFASAVRPWCPQEF
jgi:predicted acetyltransferase